MCDSDVKPSDVRIVPLHHRWDLVEACAELLNTQWQRSIGARLHSLRQSSDSYPVCLVQLEGEKLIGHARLSRVLGSRSAFVESVVVLGELRGRGYGRALMDGVERYAHNHGFTRLYLTTHDKQHFYAHLGFVLSRPVQNVGTLASIVPMEVLHIFCRSSETEDNEEKIMDRSKTAPWSVPHGVPHPPPPPPPPPPPSALALSKSASHHSCSTVVHPPPPPSDPPPAPTPPPSLMMPVEQTLEQTPYTDSRGLPIFWMHKDI